MKNISLRFRENLCHRKISKIQFKIIEGKTLGSIKDLGRVKMSMSILPKCQLPCKYMLFLSFLGNLGNMENWPH